MPLPAQGRPATDVLADLDAMKAGDVRWREGRAFTLAYNAGPEVIAIAEEAYRRFGTENALNVHAFPSLRRIQAEVVETVSGWLGADAGCAGFMTSGGTESLLMAVKAARERGRRTRGIERPNMVLPASAHAALEKGAQYFGVESRRVPVLADWRADVEAMAAAIDANTVLVVGSAPQYPQGVVDPIPAIAALAQARDINCHVDACMGGVTLHFLERLGHPVPPWNFAVPGVTSISVDLHKYGYAAKGAGVMVHRNRELRADQTFVTDNWLGGLYGCSGVLGTKSGGPIASAWAMMRHFGREGYADLARGTRATTLLLADAISSIDPLFVMTKPDSTLICFGSHDESVPTNALADALRARGWWVDRQGPPPTLHMTVSAHHEHVADRFIEDLQSCVAGVRSDAAGPGSTVGYGTVE